MDPRIPASHALQGNAGGREDDIKSSMPKSYLFDWDGCLANTLSVWMNAYIEVYGTYGVHPTPAEIVDKSWGNWEKGPENFGLKNSKEVIDKVLAKADYGLRHVAFHSGVREVLSTLSSQKVKMAVVSSTSKDILLGAISNLHATDLFDVVIAKEDVTKLKPDPEGFLKAMKIMSIKLEDSMVVGDSEKDIIAGKAAGIKTVLFYPKANEPFYSLEEMKKCEPDFVVREFNELLALLVAS